MRRLALVGVALGTLGMTMTGSAGAAGTRAFDQASEQTALGAYQRYVSAALAAVPAGRKSQEAFIASVAASCPDVLASTNLLPASAARKATETAFGEEVGLDLGITSLGVFRAPLATLARVVERLRWSKSKTATKIKRSFDAERRYLAQVPSELCTDARAVASTSAETTPTATLKFIAATTAALEAAGLKGLTQVLHTFARGNTEKREIANVNQLLTRFYAAAKASLEAVAPKALGALGISG
jgi:hypothetical protein